MFSESSCKVTMSAANHIKSGSLSHEHLNCNSNSSPDELICLLASGNRSQMAVTLFQREGRERQNFYRFHREGTQADDVIFQHFPGPQPLPGQIPKPMIWILGIFFKAQLPPWLLRAVASASWYYMIAFVRKPSLLSSSSFKLNPRVRSQAGERLFRQ